MGQEACGYPHNPNAVPVAAKRLRLDRTGRGGMTAVHLAAFHGYADALRLLLEAGSDPNAVCDDGETPLHTACTGGSTVCATLLLEHGEALETFFSFFCGMICLVHACFCFMWGGPSTWYWVGFFFLLLCLSRRG